MQFEHSWLYVHVGCTCALHWQGSVAILVARLRITLGRISNAFLFQVALLVAHIANIVAIAKWSEVRGTARCTQCTCPSNALTT